jgi:hypothetical protein
VSHNLDLGRTAAALRRRDAQRVRFDAVPPSDTVRFDAESELLDELEVKVGDAFAEDTCDRNARDTARLMRAGDWLRRMCLKYDEPLLHGENRRLALIGLSPSNVLSPDARSHPIPLGTASKTGRRLVELLGRQVHDVACTANVLSCPTIEMTGPPAYVRGARLRARLVDEKVLRTVVLGMDAARLMGLRHGAAAADLWFRWEVTEGLYYAIAPHPSGRSRWWNEPRNRERASAFFAEMRAHGESR